MGKVVRLSPAPTDDPKVRNDRAIDWLKENASFGPESTFVRREAAKIAECGQGVEFQMRIGGGLLKSGRPTILASWKGELFALELSAEQAEAFSVGERSVAFVKEPETATVRSPRPWVRLEVPLMDQPTKSGKTVKIKGSLPFKVLEEQPGNYVVCAMWHMGKNLHTSYYHKLKQSLPADGKPIEFDFDLLLVSEATQSNTGPLLIFIELCSYLDPDRRGEPVVISNCVPLLVDFNAAKNANK